MDILIIAPTSNLNYQNDELRAALRSNYRIMPLVGQVTIQSLLAALERHYDIIWFIGHSGDDGIQLSDGKLSVIDFAPLVKNSRLLLLNSCSSVGIAGKVRDATSVDVIAYLGDVEDKSAYRFGVTFIQNLQRYGENFKRAFDESIDSESDYVFLRAGRWSNMVDDLTRVMFELKTEIALLTQRVTTLEASIKNIPDKTPDDTMLRLIATALVVIALLIGYGIYVVAK